ncbi:MAG: hypothetical protein JWN84_2033, partial [Nocardioides sp.]|nr:hypothetical protein [Nocardioides sp.]
MRRVLSAAVTAVSVLALATACSDDSGGDDSNGTRVIEVTVEGGEVTPTGTRIDVAVGQPVDIVVTSDEAGELH